MDETGLPSEAILRKAIMELDEPVLFRNMLRDASGEFTWNLLQWDLSTLTEKFGDEKLPFRVGYNARTGIQWESRCENTVMTLREFVEQTETRAVDERWYYFDYKYMDKWFKDKPDIISSLNWHRFGFDKSGSDSTLWIGSRGAHTICHQDSYGCNLVAQVHGRKQWLLFPPSSSNWLHPIRVPYEESTVYSKFNMFCPTEDEERQILRVPEKPKLITLEPGDVLLVPGGWWHYVESLDLSVSVNIWLPIGTDCQSRLQEALVKLVVARIGKKLCTDSKEALGSLSYCMKLIEACLQECKNSMSTEDAPCEKKHKHSPWTATELSTQYPDYVKLLHNIEKPELQKVLTEKREKFPCTNTDPSQENVISAPDSTVSESIVNAFCHPDVISRIAEQLLKTHVSV